MTDDRRYKVWLSAKSKAKLDVSDLADEDNSFDCATDSCAFNHFGQCRYYAVEEEFPIIAIDEGCISGILE